MFISTCCQGYSPVQETYPNVHSPHAGHDVHGQHNRTEHGKLAQDIVGLLGALVHPDVDLGKVVAVCSTEQTVWQSAGGVIGRMMVLTSRNDSGCLSWLRYDLGCRPSTVRSRFAVQLPSAHCISSQSP